MQKQANIHCYECTYCFRTHKSKTGYSCEMWGHDDFACDTQLDGFCHKSKTGTPGSQLRQYQMLDSREQAERVLSYMLDIARNYGVVTRADFLEIVGHPDATSYTDNKWGWLVDSIELKAQIVTTSIGYFVDLPRAVPLM